MRSFAPAGGLATCQVTRYPSPTQSDRFPLHPTTPMEESDDESDAVDLTSVSAGGGVCEAVAQEHVARAPPRRQRIRGRWNVQRRLLHAHQLHAESTADQEKVISGRNLSVDERNR